MPGPEHYDHLAYGLAKAGIFCVQQQGLPYRDEICRQLENHQQGVLFKRLIRSGHSILLDLSKADFTKQY
jgi:hypothetical protein